jgi:hypothetical protein
MPNYAIQWQGAWTPYATYGKSLDPRSGVRAIVEEVEGLKFIGNLRLLEPFYSDLDSYRTACRTVVGGHRDPHNDDVVNRARSAVQTQRPNFLGHAQKVLDLAAQIGHVFQMAAAVIKDDKSHANLVKPVLKELAAISQGVKTDLEDFATPATATAFLDRIRGHS